MRFFVSAIGRRLNRSAIKAPRTRRSWPTVMTAHLPELGQTVINHGDVLLGGAQSLASGAESGLVRSVDVVEHNPNRDERGRTAGWRWT